MDENKFHVGAWVCDRSYGRVGYVTKNYPEHGKCRVQIIRNPDGTENDLEGPFYYSSLDVLPPRIHKDDVHSLQHVAVLFNDPEWFQELAERKGE